MLYAALTGKQLDDLPDYYDDSEEEYDAVAIEKALEAHPLVRHVAPAPPPEAQPQ